MILKGEHLGVEAYIDNSKELIELYPKLIENFTAAWNVISFRWSVSPKEAACAVGASAALVEAFNAILSFPDSESLMKDVPSIISMMEGLCEMALYT